MQQNALPIRLSLEPGVKTSMFSHDSVMGWPSLSSRIDAFFSFSANSDILFAELFRFFDFSKYQSQDANY